MAPRTEDEISSQILVLISDFLLNHWLPIIPSEVAWPRNMKHQAPSVELTDILLNLNKNIQCSVYSMHALNDLKTIPSGMLIKLYQKHYKMSSKKVELSTKIMGKVWLGPLFYIVKQPPPSFFLDWSP